MAEEQWSWFGGKVRWRKTKKRESFVYPSLCQMTKKEGTQFQVKTNSEQNATKLLSLLYQEASEDTHMRAPSLFIQHVTDSDSSMMYITFFPAENISLFLSPHNMECRRQSMQVCKGPTLPSLSACRLCGQVMISAPLAARDLHPDDADKLRFYLDRLV